MIVNSYWKLLRHLSNEAKLRLIAKLSESLVDSYKEKEEENLANEFYGAWEDSKTAEELIKKMSS